jgi:hypothetical protein
MKVEEVDEKVKSTYVISKNDGVEWEEGGGEVGEEGSGDY